MSFSISGSVLSSCGRTLTVGPTSALPLPVPIPTNSKDDPRVQEALSSWSSLQDRVQFCDRALGLPRNQLAKELPVEYQRAWRDRGRFIEGAGWGLMATAGFAEAGRGMVSVFTVGGPTLLPFMMGVVGLTAGLALFVLPLERLAHSVTNMTLERRLQAEKAEVSQRLDRASEDLLGLVDDLARNPQGGDGVAVEEQYVEIGGLKVPRRSLPTGTAVQMAQAGIE